MFFLEIQLIHYYLDVSFKEDAFQNRVDERSEMFLKK